MKIKNVCISILVLFTVFISTGVIKAAQPKQKVLHMAISAEFKKYYDPSNWNLVNLQPFFSCVYSTLFKLDQDFKPYPFLLEKFERRGKSVIFYLKNGICFSDGSPITSEDAVETIETVMKDITYPSPIYKVIDGGEKLFREKSGHCSGIKKLGPKTFEIRFIRDDVDFTNILTASIFSILPRDRNKTRAICSGPFQVDEYKEKGNETVVKLKQNPFYTGKKSKIDLLYIHFYSNHRDFERAVYLGEPDLFLMSLYSTIPGSRVKYNYFKTPLQGAYYFVLNAQKGPFKDKRLRTFLKNFVMALNLSGTGVCGLTIPAELVLPYNLPGRLVFKRMEKADFKPFIPSKPVKIKCMNVDIGFRKDLFQLLQKKLKKCNMELQLEWEKDLSSVQTHERTGDIDLTSYFYLVDVPLSFYFYETLFIPGHELNLFGNIVPEALQLLDAYRQETDELKKLKTLSHLEEIAQDEAILIPVFNPLCVLGYKNHVKGVCIDSLLGMCIEDMDVEKRH